MKIFVVILIGDLVVKDKVFVEGFYIVGNCYVLVKVDDEEGLYV